MNKKIIKRTGQNIKIKRFLLSTFAALLVASPFYIYLMGSSLVNGYLSEFGVDPDMYQRSTDYYYFIVSMMFIDGSSIAITKFNYIVTALIIISLLFATYHFINGFAIERDKKNIKSDEKSIIIPYSEIKTDAPHKDIAEIFVIKPLTYGYMLFVILFIFLVILSTAVFLVPITHQHGVDLAKNHIDEFDRCEESECIYIYEKDKFHSENSIEELNMISMGFVVASSPSIISVYNGSETITFNIKDYVLVYKKNEAR